MRRPRPALVVLIGSLVLLIGTPLVWAGFVASNPAVGQSIDAVGDRPVPSEVDEVPAEPLIAGPKVPRIGTPVEEAPAAAPVAPVRITIPSLGVDAPVDSVGVYEDGWVEIPEDVMRVGWYRFGAAPNVGAGSTVIVGHRDGVSQGAGAFYSISALNPGDVIDIELADGQVRSYEVVAREAVSRDLLPSGEIFATDGPEILTLISCIGYFDRSRGGYQQNVIVSAVPLVDRLRS
jgi:sortase (surface protein transpeptidase)